MQLKKAQKTYVPTEKDLEKKWYLVDAKGKTLGPLATKIANLLRGKGKAHFTPQLDCGDHVVVIHAKEIRLARNKLDTKLYYWHTKYPGGLKSRSAREVLAKKPDKVLYDAVRGMLPRNRLRKNLIKKLHLFPGAEHNHKAQAPTPLTF
ncbi:50S ribosomal protein L13 [Candidatus Peregrinibacteria bacterium]|nr:50S ribosomal protein L13 [Candidatus Peregrinibacteria bacterium]